MAAIETDLIGRTVRFTDLAADARGTRHRVAPGELARIRAVWINRDENMRWLEFLLETADGRLVQFPEGPYFTLYPARDTPGPQPPDPEDPYGTVGSWLG